MILAERLSQSPKVVVGRHITLLPEQQHVLQRREERCAQEEEESALCSCDEGDARDEEHPGKLNLPIQVGEVRFVARAEIIYDRNIVAESNQPLGDTGTNKARSPRDEAPRPSRDHRLAMSPLVTMPERPYLSDGRKKLKKSLPLPSGPSSHTITV